MDYQQITVEQKKRVNIIYMHRPEKRNALSEKMTAEIIAAIEKANNDTGVGAVVLTGTGMAFSAGADLADFAAMATKTAPILHQEGISSTELFKIAAKMKKPLIAAVNGAAMGGGCGLVAMCHLAVASDKAIFSTPEVKVGIFPFVIFPLFVRAMGYKKALDMALTGRVLSASEALAMGLVSQVFPDADFYSRAIELAQQIADRSPLVLRLGLHAYHATMDMELNKAMDYLNTLRVIDFLSEDLREGALAFTQKREPKWKGQ